MQVISAGPEKKAKIFKPLEICKLNVAASRLPIGSVSTQCSQALTGVLCLGTADTTIGSESILSHEEYLQCLPTNPSIQDIQG